MPKPRSGKLKLERKIKICVHEGDVHIDSEINSQQPKEFIPNTLNSIASIFPKV